MDAYGFLGTQRVSDERGKVVIDGPEYKRSMSLSSVTLDIPLKEQVSWFSTSMVNSGILKFNPNVDDGIIKLSQGYGPSFQAYALEKVNNSPHGDCQVPVVGGEFYPALYEMLKNKRDWGPDFAFGGRALFQPGLLEWTEFILANFEGKLREAGILGAVSVAHYPFDFSPNVWRAFCELWGPQSNTLHHGAGEMGISLYDLKIIGGLPISGDPYEEYIPPNKALRASGPYPSTVAELLNIHSRLCIAYKKPFIYWHQWLTHFYRKKRLYGAFGQSSNRKFQRYRDEKPVMDLDISREGALAAFLAFWLSRFVLPTKGSKVRPETFCMACLMAQGSRISLAPTVLGYIYHGLGEIASHPVGPGLSNACLPSHYVLGWLAEYFPRLYHSRPDRELSQDDPYLARYAGIAANEFSINHARVFFRTELSVRFRPFSFPEEKGRKLIDDGRLNNDDFEMLVSMRSALLPVRVGECACVEPYYPNRFARQFGFDQGVPSNKLSFSFNRRHLCSFEELASAQHVLLRSNTVSHFYIPRSTRLGQCTWWYCRWWMRSCAPYLKLSVWNIFETLTKTRATEKDDIFIVTNLKEFAEGLRREVSIS